MKNIAKIFVVLIMVFSLGACNGETKPIEETRDVTLYFANNEYILTGNEELEKLVPENRTIEIKDTTVEAAVVAELQKGTENPDLSTLIPETTKIIDVTRTDDTVFVNFDRDGLNGSSLEESFTINQIVASMLELEGVHKVQFLVDGEITESLMGHFGAEEPFDHTM